MTLKGLDFPFLTMGKKGKINDKSFLNMYFKYKDCWGEKQDLL